jgi:septum site-determining protein MinD
MQAGVIIIMGRIIGILSGKGGVGKTTLAANLGTVLSHEYKKKVVLIDANVTAPNLDLHFGLYDESQFTLRDVLNGRASLEEAISICSRTGVKIIQSPLSKGKINLKNLKNILKKLQKTHDIIILDCAPALGEEVYQIIDMIDEAIIVTMPLIPEVASALKTINSLNERKKVILGLVVNRAKNKNYELKIDEIKAVSKLPVLSIIQEDAKVPNSISEGMPVVLYDKNSKVSIQFRRLAANLIGQEFNEPNVLEKLMSLFNFKRRTTPTFVSENTF